MLKINKIKKYIYYRLYRYIYNNYGSTNDMENLPY